MALCSFKRRISDFAQRSRFFWAKRMAGGSGVRFWPLSTSKKPKQLLCLFDEKSLLRHTFERLLPLTDATHIYVSTAKSQKSLICKELPEVPLKNIFVEPIPKNTAAAIGYCATCLSHINENAMMVVLPADHYISDETKFQKAILSCFPAASKKKIVTMLGLVIVMGLPELICSRNKGMTDPRLAITLP